MKKYRLCLIFIILLSIIAAGNGASPLPASFFIIEPSGISNAVFTAAHSEFRIETDDEDFTLPETANQKIISSGKTGGRLAVILRTGKNSIPSGSGMNKFLVNTPFLNTDRDEIKKTAAGFARSKDPCKEISLFVYRHISDKKIGIPMIPAVSILKQKAGDCTEHSVLTAALLRSLKIPARAVTGLILTENFSGNKNVFVYHMWVEAYTSGRWVMVDSTRPLNVYPNRYIALAYHNLMTEAPLEFLAAASAVNGIKITYVK